MEKLLEENSRLTTSKTFIKTSHLRQTSLWLNIALSFWNHWITRMMKVLV